MALMNCPECGREVSSAAASCPNCGHPITRPAAPPPPPPPVRAPAPRTSGCAQLALFGVICFIGLIVVGQCSRSERQADQAQAFASAASAPTLSAEEQRKEWLDYYNQPLGDAKKLEYAEAILRSDANSAEAQQVKPGIEALRAKVAHAEAEAKERGDWRYDNGSTALEKRPYKSAAVESQNTFNFDFPYQGEQRAMLAIRNHPQYGKEVFLSIREGQIICSSYSCPVSVVFDESKPLRFEGNEPADNSTETVFIPAYSTFLKRLATAKTVRIGFTVYQQGDQVAQFKVKGFDPAELK